jgi:HAD superfamily hydrolase (TIGR01509 family)
MLVPTQQDLRDAKQVILKELLDKEKIGAYENTLRLIRDLKDKKIPVGVGTMSVNADTILNKLGIRTSIDVVVDGNDVKDKNVPGKPSKKFYLEMAKRLGVDPKKSVVVEDSIRGIRSAVNGKFGYIIGLGRNKGDYDRLKGAGADIVLKDIGSLSVEEIMKQFKAKFNFNDASDNLEAVIFDMDGVICNVEPLRFISWKQVFDDYLKWRERIYGEIFKEFSMEDYLEYAANKPNTEVKAFLGSRGISIPENNKRALDEIIMRRRLEELRKIVDVKLEEFDRVAVSPEEKLDRERAMKRIENVFTIGKLLTGFDAGLFKQYINEVAEPLLKLDVRNINFILASRTGNSFNAMGALTEGYPSVIAEGYIKLMIKRKELWNKKFYYLPGLPIVVEAEGLSNKSMAKLNRAASMIVKSGWLTLRPETLSYVESIRPEVERNSLLGYSTAFFRGINISVQGSVSPESIALTMIHEGTHQYARRAIFTHEDKLDSKKINRRSHYLQPEEKTAKRFLHELYAYGAELQFQLYFIKVYNSRAVSDKFIDYSYSCIFEARKLISALEEIGYRKDSVNTAKELWNDLSASIKRLDKQELLFFLNRKVKVCL